MARTQGDPIHACLKKTLRCLSLGLLPGYLGVKGDHDMTQVQQLIQILKFEEEARHCTNRAEAQRLIRKGDEAKQRLWGDTEFSYGH